MSKKQNTDAVETTPATLPAVITENNFAEAMDALEKVSDEDLHQSIEHEYLEFEEGDVWNLAYLGTMERTFTENDERVAKDCAEFQDKTGKLYYNGNAFLVSRLKALPTPNLVRIVCTGSQKNKSGNGKYKTFNIFSAIK